MYFKKKKKTHQLIIIFSFQSLDKENKWFNNIIGIDDPNNPKTHDNIDTAEFSLQGLGKEDDYDDSHLNSPVDRYVGDGPNIAINDCTGEVSYSDVYDCTDPLAINYNPLANIDDDSCEYCDTGSYWNGDRCTCLSCEHVDAITTTPGCCNTINALNYDCESGNTSYPCSDGVTCDDGSCISIVYGCTDPTAWNYNAGAAVDDNSCIYVPGCMDCGVTWELANNQTCPDGQATLPGACNYDPSAEYDDDSCDYSCY